MCNFSCLWQNEGAAADPVDIVLEHVAQDDVYG